MYGPSSSLPEPSLDHALLIAGAAVSQASTPTAMLAERLAQERRADLGDSLAALVHVFAHRDASAAAALQGSFHPRVAQTEAGKAQGTMMKPGFTLAF